MKTWQMIGMVLILTAGAIAAPCMHAHAAPQIPTAPPGDIVISGDLDNKPPTRGAAMDQAVISLGAFPIFTIRTPAAGFTIAERERIVYIRLTEIISCQRITPDIFEIRHVRGKPTLYVGDYRFITVYPRDAAAANMDSMSLANKWLASLRRVLPQVAPYFSVAPPETYDVSVGGMLLFRLRDPNGFSTLAARGRQVEVNVANALVEGRGSDVKVQQIDDTCAVSVSGAHIVLATPKDAQLAGLESAGALAEKWAERLRKALPVIKPQSGS
ncbi:MAG: hypothetical protein ACLFWB_13330 [Armatimonadota bacterium]